MLRMTSRNQTAHRADPVDMPDAADALEMYVRMLRVRAFEQRVERLFDERALRGTAHSAVGQEAIAAGACLALECGDVVFSHHRGHGHLIAMGGSLRRMFSELLGRSDGYCRGFGGSMHVADPEIGMLGANGIVGASMGLGLGAAKSALMDGRNRAVVAFFGDGATNEGIFHEAMNMASVMRLPLIFFCENNQYGLSTPQSHSTAGPSIAARAAAYSVVSDEIDGNDAFEIWRATRRALTRARAGEGPTLIEARTYRWGDHNMRPSWPNYRPDAEEASWKERDPLIRMRALLAEHRYLASAQEAAEISDVIEREVEEAVTAAKADTVVEPSEISRAITVPHAKAGVEPEPGHRSLTYVDAINEAIASQMAEDSGVFVVGEDIARIGGIFGVTRGLLDRFGAERVIDAPISEHAIAGLALGAAICGKRPVVELQIFDFVTHMMDTIVNQAAKYRFMLGGRGAAPLVFRGPQGGGTRLAAQHSQSLEAWFAHVPGLVVLAPSNAYDAKGLMIAAIRDDNPCVFLEHKMLYLGQPQPVPEHDYALPIGRARIRRSGTDLTVIATLNMVDHALKAADELSKQGWSVEVIDPRTLRPLDMDTLIGSVRRTNRCLVVHEAWRTGGVGAEIAAEISEKAFDWLDAPVTRLCGADAPMPFAAELERTCIPTAKDIVRAARELLESPAPS